MKKNEKKKIWAYIRGGGGKGGGAYNRNEKSATDLMGL